VVVFAELIAAVAALLVVAQVLVLVLVVVAGTLAMVVATAVDGVPGGATVLAAAVGIATAGVTDASRAGV